MSQPSHLITAPKDLKHYRRSLATSHLHAAEMPDELFTSLVQIDPPQVDEQTLLIARIEAKLAVFDCNLGRRHDGRYDVFDLREARNLATFGDLQAFAELNGIELA